MPMKVFISYSFSDADYAKHLGDRLRELGILVYQVSPTTPRVDVSDYIRRSLDDSSALVVLLSDSARSSPWVAFEIGAALSKGKTVIPVIKGSSSIPSILTKFKAVDGSNEDSVVARKIAEAIQK